MSYLNQHARVLHGGFLLHLAHDLHLAVVGHCDEFAFVD